MDLANLVRRAGATLLLAMLCLVTFAQGKTVTGTVVDGTGEPLIGVSVLVKGTTVLLRERLPISTVSFLFRT